MPKQYLLLLVLILLGLALRLYRIDAVSFRGDEAFTVLNWVSKPIAETLQSEIPLRDPQPPLAFALFRGWALLFGTGEFSMRVLPALFSLIGIPALYALGSRIAGRAVGLLAALFWVTHPFLIWHAQDAKAYAIWASLSATGIWLALRALEKNRRIDWLLYIVVATTTAYLYYLELFTLFALNLFVIIASLRDRQRLLRWFGSMAIIGLLLAPWFLQERLLFSSGYGGTTFPFELSRVFTWLLPGLNLGVQTIPEATLKDLWPLVLLVLGAGLVSIWRINRRYTLLLGLVGFLPVILLSLVSLRLNVFAPRYVLATVAAYVLLVSAVIVTCYRLIQSRPMKLLLPVTLTIGWLLLTGASLRNNYFESEFSKAPDWRGLATYLEDNADENDFVVQAAADEAFTLYFDNLTAFERLPANPNQSASEITGILEQAQANHRSIWLVAQTPEDWPNANIAPDWLAANMQQVRDTHAGTLRVKQYMPWNVNNLTGTSMVRFDEVAEIAQIELSKTPDPSEALYVWVYWRPIAQTTQPLKAFVHLVGPANPATGTPLWSQDDQFPQDGRTDTTSWSISEVYRDVFEIPLAHVPPGDYVLHIGLYNAATGDRIQTGTTDSYIAETVTLP